MMGRVSAGSLVVGLLLACGCSSPRPTHFLHQGQRLKYSISDDELKTLQFYISDYLVIHRLDTAENGSPTKTAIVVQVGTPGVVIDAGPQSFVVSFDEEGIGVPFVTAAEKSGDMYWLASRTEDGAALRQVRLLDDHTLIHDGKTYEILEGADAHIMIERADLDELIDNRPHPSGRTQE